MGSSVPEGKKGLRAYLETTEGLRPADKVAVTARAGDPVPATRTVVLGRATTTEAPAGLERRAETVTLSCVILVTKIGSGETISDEARDGAYEVMDLIRSALKADPSAAGAVPGPGHIDVVSSDSQEMPVSWDGQAAERSELEFQLAWTSHI
jgi:hypothetical protein